MPTKSSTLRRRSVKAIQEIAFSDDSNSSTKLSALKILIDLCDRCDSDSQTQKKLDKILAMLDGYAIEEEET